MAADSFSETAAARALAASPGGRADSRHAEWASNSVDGAHAANRRYGEHCRS